MTAREIKKIDWEPVQQDLNQMMDKSLCFMPIFPNVWRGSGEAVIRTIRRLSNYGPPQIVIAMAMATGADYRKYLASLARLKLSSKTALILALDSEDTITDKAWLEGLRKGLQKISRRFTYAEIVFTSNRPVKYLLAPWLFEIWKEQIEKIRPELSAAGIKTNVNYGFWPWVVREQIRIIMKHSDCRYVFWLDADVRPPRDILPRLLKLIEHHNADLASGWYINRHTEGEPVCKTAIQCTPETAEEEEFYRALADQNSSLWVISAKRGAAVGSLDDWYKEGYPIAPSKLRRSKDPIELGYTGFGCVLLKREINDKISFFDFDGGITTEDITVCLAARKKGYKLLLDPTCYCEHVERS